MLLNGLSLLATQNAEHLVVRNEVESGVGIPLGIEIVVEGLLTEFQLALQNPKSVQLPVGKAGLHD